jgi:hypothetical protein
LNLKRRMIASRVMSWLQNKRQHLRSELEAPSALRRFGSGWISGVLGLVLGLAGLAGRRAMASAAIRCRSGTSRS